MKKLTYNIFLFTILMLLLVLPLGSFNMAKLDSNVLSETDINYENKIQLQQKTIELLRSDNSNLKEQIKQLNNQIQNLQTQVTNLNNEIQQNQQFTINTIDTQDIPIENE